MMVAVFLALFLALVFGWLRRGRLAVAFSCLCLALAVWLFLFEVYSPDYGFRMPWIQTQWQAPSTLLAVGEA